MGLIIERAVKLHVVFQIDDAGCTPRRQRPRWAIFLDLCAFPAESAKSRGNLRAMRDIQEVRKQCKRFISTMAENRPNCDDAGVARRILEELNQYGDITPRTRARLLHWCHTNGSLYKRGVPIAQAISLGLYGRIPQMNP